jgi:uncharacterized protein (DUF1501 family)
MDRRIVLKTLLSGLVLPLAPLNISKAYAMTGRRLILLELSGANDGLNTVVPIGDHRYHELRPTIGLKKSEVFDIGDELTLHSAMKSMDMMWQDSELAIIHGLGYPGANRSHFKSIALWETGGDGTKSGRTGWLTDDIENLDGSNALDAHGISLDGGMGVFASPGGVWLSMTSAQEFRRLSSQEISKTDTNNPALAVLLDRAQTLNSSMEKISKKISGKNQIHFRVRGRKLGAQLGTAAQLIHAGIETPVIKVQLGGFDTHEGQPHRHRRLLRELGRSLSDFRRGLKRIGQWENTLIMTYSEFGRRTVENHTDGTDHGTAAPHFVMGGAVNGGMFGKHPDLGALVEGDMQFTMDYRSVYERVLSDWFGLRGNRFISFRDKRLDGLIKI